MLGRWVDGHGQETAAGIGADDQKRRAVGCVVAQDPRVAIEHLVRMSDGHSVCMHLRGVGIVEKEVPEIDLHGHPS